VAAGDVSRHLGLPGAFVTSFGVDASRDDGEGNVDVGQQRINVPRRA